MFFMRMLMETYRMPANWVIVKDFLVDTLVFYKYMSEDRYESLSWFVTFVNNDEIETYKRNKKLLKIDLILMWFWNTWIEYLAASADWMEMYPIMNLILSGKPDWNSSSTFLWKLSSSEYKPMDFMHYWTDTYEYLFYIVGNTLDLASSDSGYSLKMSKIVVKFVESHFVEDTHWVGGTVFIFHQIFVFFWRKII